LITPGLRIFDYGLAYTLRRKAISQGTMSFGISISDFVTYAQLASHVYNALKTGPTECHAFAKDVLTFRQVLLKVGENLRDANGRLSWEEHDVLSHHILKFEELCSSIMDGSPPTIYRTYRDRFRYRRLRQDSNDPHIDRDEEVDKGPRILF
jgi:hypothetical protein